MFDDKFFESWLDSEAQKVMSKISSGEGISSEQMMILLLKAQTNHFAHLDIDLRNDMKELREDMDKRFEQVDKRFEQVDKRFEQLTSRIDHFMIWSFATTVSVGGMIVAAIKFL
jgi:archaellum component FlaC